MTCIVAVKANDGTVFMGGDSAGVAGHDVAIMAQPKVFRLGEFLVGYTSSFRMGQLLQYALTPPPFEYGENLTAYMVNKFVSAARECLKAGGYARKENEVESGGFFLVSVRGRIFRIEDDYQVSENVDGYDVVGCGEYYAKGALRTLVRLGTPELKTRTAAIVRTALETAEYFSGGVRGPFTIISSKPND